MDMDGWSELRPYLSCSCVLQALDRLQFASPTPVQVCLFLLLFFKLHPLILVGCYSSLSEEQGCCCSGGKLSAVDRLCNIVLYTNRD